MSKDEQKEILRAANLASELGILISMNTTAIGRDSHLFTTVENFRLRDGNWCAPGASHDPSFEKVLLAVVAKTARECRATLEKLESISTKVAQRLPAGSKADEENP